MNRASLIFVSIAALLIGGLIGLNLSSAGKASNEVAASAETGPSTQPAGSLTYSLINPDDYPAEEDEFGRPVPATLGENFKASNKAFKQESLSIELGLDGEVEYKVEMQQGDSVVYRWSIANGAAYYDFHAHPQHEETTFFTRYVEGEGSEHAGSIVAAYEGQHGWFWLNIADQPITIELEVAGFYDQIVKIALDEG